mmetsp:Transcript_63030/g.108213  ORF Transcript_63030/g.108213 Transcript_63030/m.108213 type:complete len:249 (+) Transcript_63030:126-872(+)
MRAEYSIREKRSDDKSAQAFWFWNATPSAKAAAASSTADPAGTPPVASSAFLAVSSSSSLSMVWPPWPFSFCTAAISLASLFSAALRSSSESWVGVASCVRWAWATNPSTSRLSSAPSFVLSIAAEAAAALFAALLACCFPTKERRASRGFPVNGDTLMSSEEVGCVPSGCAGVDDDVDAGPLSVEPSAEPSVPENLVLSSCPPSSSSLSVMASSSVGSHCVCPLGCCPLLLPCSGRHSWSALESMAL